MKSVAATNPEDTLGKVLEGVRQEPVAITRNGRRVAVIVSADEYDRLAALEDACWVEQARRADAEPGLGHEASMAYVRSRLGENLFPG